jgi:alginate O-acetyltransferase complex protein AlgI
MVFNSIEFLIFILIFFILWPICRKNNNSRWILIIISSLVFYGWWDWRFLFLIVFSGVLDFFLGLQIARSKEKFIWLLISIVSNLGFLSIFKYSVFFATVLQDFFLLFNVKTDFISAIPEFALILPVGISFYTFKTLSYTIDVYRGKLEPSKNFLHFASFVVLFPELVAGPIIRAKDMLRQLARYRIPNQQEIWNALKLIVFGFFQKTVIADNLSLFVDSAFEGKSGFDGSIYWWIVMIAFSFQIYCDFSGYSAIARGIAKLMGYHFKMNFNHPYISRSLREFWTRWHISLSEWFRDYVYIPLGGSRKGLLFGIYALTITMLLSGLWHGANYTYILWAVVHILFLAIERLTKWPKYFKNFSLISTLIIFFQVLIAWVFFRSESVSQATDIFYQMTDFNSLDLSFVAKFSNNLFFLLLGIAIEVVILASQFIKTLRVIRHSNLVEITSVTLAIMSILFLRGEGAQFIYFQF